MISPHLPAVYIQFRSVCGDNKTKKLRHTIISHIYCYYHLTLIVAMKPHLSMYIYTYMKTAKLSRCVLYPFGNNNTHTHTHQWFWFNLIAHARICDDKRVPWRCDTNKIHVLLGFSPLRVVNVMKILYTLQPPHTKLLKGDSPWNDMSIAKEIYVSAPLRHRARVMFLIDNAAHCSMRGCII